MQVIQIHTNQYAGKFEREMCAYITGQYGDCGTGDVIAQGARKSIKNLSWFEHHLQWVEDEAGCYRPCAIAPTSGWFNNGMGGAYKADVPGNLDIARSTAVIALREYYVTVENPQSDEFFQRYEAEWATFPSYQSVAIFIDDYEVPEEVREEVVRRAEAFCKFRDIELLSVDEPVPFAEQHS